MRSTRISRWSSPIPLMIVWPNSWSVVTRKLGSSAARRLSATPIFSWSALVLGSTATSMTGSGNSIRSRMIGLFGSHSVSPVVVSLRPAMRDDVAGVSRLDVLAVVRMHQQHAPDLFLLVLDRIRDLRRRLELARIDAGEGQRADERVVHDLERQRRERRVVRRLAGVGLVAVGLDAFDRRNVERATADSRPPRRARAGRPCS